MACGTSGEATAVEDGESDESVPPYLYRRYRIPLLRFVLPIVNGDRLFAEDVVQETMLRAWLHRDELDPERAGPWLYAVARNVAISSYHRRRGSRPPEVAGGELDVSVADGGFDRVLDVELVRSALLQLGAEQRDVVIQLYYLQRSVAQVADNLRIPRGTVRSRAFYGLRELRRVLEQLGVTR